MPQRRRLPADPKPYLYAFRWTGCPRLHRWAEELTAELARLWLGRVN